MRSVRLNEEEERQLEFVAHSTGQTPSEVMRQAIAERYRQLSKGSFAARLSDFIGCVRGGPPTDSSRTGREFRALLEKKAGRRNKVSRGRPSKRARSRKSSP